VFGFLTYFVFDEANKWRYLGEYYKTKHLPKCEIDFFIFIRMEGCSTHSLFGHAELSTKGRRQKNEYDSGIAGQWPDTG